MDGETLKYMKVNFIYKENNHVVRVMEAVEQDKDIHVP